MRFLVTGGAGFIGSHLAEELLSEGNEVIVVDNFSSGRRDNLPFHNKKLKIIKGDIRNLSVLKNASKGCKVIFHLAEYIPETKKIGEGHIIKFSVLNPQKDLDVNVKGTINVLEASRLNDCKVVFTSSAAVYGNYENKIRETFATNPISPYGVFKLSSELLIKAYNKMYGIPFVICRIFNSYGPRQRKYLMYDVLLKLKKNQKTITLLGDGNQKRDFIFVKDTVNALLLSSRKLKNDIINIGNGQAIKIIDVIKTITKTKKINPKIKFSGKSWRGDIQTLVSNNTKLKKIGYKQRYSLEAGIKRLIEWFEKVE